MIWRLITIDLDASGMDDTLGKFAHELLLLLEAYTEFPEDVLDRADVMLRDSHCRYPFIVGGAGQRAVVAPRQADHELERRLFASRFAPALVDVLDLRRQGVEGRRHAHPSIADSAGPAQSRRSHRADVDGNRPRRRGQRVGGRKIEEASMMFHRTRTPELAQDLN